MLSVHLCMTRLSPSPLMPPHPGLTPPLPHSLVASPKAADLPNTSHDNHRWGIFAVLRWLSASLCNIFFSSIRNTIFFLFLTVFFIQIWSHHQVEMYENVQCNKLAMLHTTYSVYSILLMSWGLLLVCGGLLVKYALLHMYRREHQPLPGKGDSIKFSGTNNVDHILWPKYYNKYRK